MWHTVSAIADLNKLPEADLVDFAISRDDKYSIYIDNGTAMVNTFNIYYLLNDFKHFAQEQVEVIEDDVADTEQLAETVKPFGPWTDQENRAFQDSINHHGEHANNGDPKCDHIGKCVLHTHGFGKTETMKCTECGHTYTHRWHDTSSR